MFLLLVLFGCLVAPSTPGGDDTNRHSGSVAEDTADY